MEGQSAAWWAGCVARARRLASLPESHFWELTPGEVDEILHEAVAEWRAKERTADCRAGMICSSLYNCHRDPKTRPEPFTPDDFFPPEKPAPKPEPTQSEIAAKARSAMKVFQTLNPE